MHTMAVSARPLRTCGYLVLLASFLLISTGLTDAKYIDPYCPSYTTNCSCTNMDASYEFECPAYDAEISVHIKPNKDVLIDCPTMNDRNVYRLLPRMQIGQIPYVVVQRCPTPPGGAPFVRVFQQLGIQGTANLMLKYGSTALVREHFAQLDGLQRLIIQRYDLTAMPDDVFELVRNVTWLSLHKNTLHLTARLLSDLDQLVFLELGYNGLLQLVPGVFRSQRKLRTLSLWGNNLTSVTQAQLDGLVSLVDLDLSANKMGTMEAGVFDGLTNLSTIHLSSNQWRSLPDGLLAHTKNVSRFTLTNNDGVMETLPSRLFAALPVLNYVTIECGLVRLPGDLFAGTENVENITLSNNHLVALPEEIFAGLTRLLDLDLSNNRLEHLEDGMFTTLTNLLVLRLEHNQLTKISDKMLVGMQSLRELHLGGNRLHTIGNLAFRTNTNLLNLQLADNQLTFVSESDGFMSTDDSGSSPFTGLADLRTLNLRNNSLTFMLTDWNTFNRKLELIDVSYNQIRSFGLRDLKTMALNPVTTNLTHNAITSIDFDMLNLDALRQLTLNIHLDHNPLDCSCNLMRFVQLLSSSNSTNNAELGLHLNMAVDDLRCAAPPTKRGRLASSLRDTELTCPLDPANASTRRCPMGCECSVRPAEFVMIVNCSASGLAAVPQLPNPTEVRLNFTELHIDHNNISELPLVRQPGRNATGWDYVTKLYASHNQIRKLEASNIPERLRSLSVHHNQLQGLNGSLLAQFNRSRPVHMQLGNNPWRCNCEARSLLLFVQKNVGHIGDADEILCTLEENKKPVLMRAQRPIDLCPDDNVVLVLACLMVMLFGLLAGAAMAFFYKYEQQIKMWLFAHNLLTWWVTELEADGHKEYDGFVSYSHKDHEFVSREIVGVLEQGELPYKLCVHDRDWLVGGAITQSIADSVDKSRRTLIVLTKNFLESDWGRMEFRVAHKGAENENRARVIIIVVGELADMKLDSMDAEMKAYLQTNTYIKWGDPWFWEKLRYAMPHLRRLQQHQQPQHYQHHIRAAVKGTDDKLDLIAQQSPPTPPPMATPPAELANQRFVVDNGGGLQGALNGHVNGAFIINAHAKQSDV